MLNKQKSAGAPRDGVTFAIGLILDNWNIVLSPSIYVSILLEHGPQSVEIEKKQMPVDCIFCYAILSRRILPNGEDIFLEITNGLFDRLNFFATLYLS